jgi:hypothetical protein
MRVSTWRLSGVVVIALLRTVQQGGSAEPKASTVEERFGTALVPANAAGFASVRADEILQVAWVQTLLKKLGADAGMIDAGVDSELFIGKLANLERMMVVMMPPSKNDPEPEPVGIFVSAKPINRDKLLEKVKHRKLAETKIKDVTVYGDQKLQHSDSYALLDEKTLLLGPAAGVREYVVRLAEKKADDSLGDFSFKDLDPKAQAVAVMIPQRALPEGLTADKLPQDLKPFASLIGAAWVTVEGRVDDEISLVTKIKAGKDGVKEVSHSAEAGVKMLGELVAMPLKDKEFHDDPDAKNFVKVFEQFVADVKKIKVQTTGDIVQAQFQTKVDPEVTAAAFTEAVQKVRESANRSISGNNLRQIGIAMTNYDTTRNGLPRAAIYSKEDKPLLSWRVAILPYIEQVELYEQFKLDEPWDSETNKKLLEKMPKIYETPGANLKDKSLTYYKVFTGKGALFDPKLRFGLGNIPAGASRTLMAIEAGEPVPWTKPDDISFDPKKPLPKLFPPHKKGILVLLADGSVRTIPSDVSDKKLRAAIDTNEGCDDLSGDKPKGSGSPGRGESGSGSPRTDRR